VPAGDVIENTATGMTQRLVRTAAETDGELLEMEATYPARSPEPPAHLHPQQEERFEIVAGEVTVRLDGEERTLMTGDVLEIPAGTVHAMWNGGDEIARLRWETRPAMRTEELFRALAVIAEAAMSGEPQPDDSLSGEALLREFRNEFQLA
jgi:quercetin dioxygenase-like cupin family protein